MGRKLISFTITNAGQGDYKKVQDKINQVVSTWAKLGETLFLTITERSSVNLREIIKEVNIEGEFKNIFVTDWSHPSAWEGYGNEIANWIRNN